MPITLNCPKCHKPFRVRDESIGGRVRCPSCAAVLQVPASISPASAFGFDPPAGAVVNPAEMSGAIRPMAEDLMPTPPPSDDDLLLGGPTRPQSMEYGSAGMALPAPPSIKFRGMPAPQAPAPQSPHAHGPTPQAPAPMLPTAPMPYSGANKSSPSLNPYSPQAGGSVHNQPKPQSSFVLPPSSHPPTQLPGTTAGNEWAVACSGLSMIQGGLFLLMIPLLGGIGHGIWAYLKPAQALSNAAGYLGRADLPFWKELVVLYTALPVTFGLLTLFFGRAKCTAVPDGSTARGLARAATFCTLLGILGAATAAVCYLGYGARFNLPPVTAPLSLCVLTPAAALADLFTLFFIAQVGWAAGMPRLLLSVGTFLTFVLVVPAMLVAAHLFYPVIEPLQKAVAQHGSPFAGPDKAATIRILIAGGIFLLYALITLIRYFSLAGTAKRAIRNQFGHG